MTRRRFKTKLYLILLGVLLAKLVISYVLFLTVGMSTAPEGGLDSIGQAIAHVFLWEVFAIYVPIAEIIGLTLVWLFMSHRKVFIGIIAGALTIAAGCFVYENCFKKIILTPEKAASKVQPYEEWKKENSGSYLYSDFDYTEQDFICEYADNVIYDACYTFHELHHDGDDELKEEYISAAMEQAFRNTSYVVSWEYVPDAETLIYSHRTVTSEMKGIEEYYGKPLNINHYFNRYGDPIANGFYTSTPLMVIFYKDGTIDLAHGGY